MRLELEGTLLTASTDDRTLTYLLAPYGQEGRTSLGRVTLAAGALSVPDRGALVGNLEHDRTRPVSKAVTITEEPDGLHATVRVLDTQAGTDLLLEAAEGVRTGVSVEVSDPVIKAGKLLAGELTGYAHVTRPAFPSALLVAADTETTVNDDGSVTISTDDATVTVTVAAPSEPATEDPTVDDTTTTPPEDVAVASAPAAAPAGTLTASQRTPAALTASDVSQRVAAIMQAAQEGHNKRDLLAALSDLTWTAIGADVQAPDWLGKLWQGVAYQRIVVPLLSSSPFTTDLRTTAWKWTTAPDGATYAGNKAPIPSNAAATDPVTSTGKRWAGGHDHDRALVDFPNPSYWDAYWQAMVDSYAAFTDDAAADAIKAGATPVTPGAVPPGTNGAAAALIDGALAVLPKGLPTFALMAPDVWRGYVLSPASAAVEQISKSLGLDEGTLSGITVRPCASLAAGDVIVGIRQAVTWRELGGGSPIRVEAVNVELGGIDTAAFGYYDTIVNEPAGVALLAGVDPDTTPGTVIPVGP